MVSFVADSGMHHIVNKALILENINESKTKLSEVLIKMNLQISLSMLKKIHLSTR